MIVLRRLTFISLTGIIGACGPAARDDLVRVRAAEIEVYRAIVESLYVRPQTRLIVLSAVPLPSVSRRTGRAEEVRWYRSDSLRLTDSMLRDFEARNANHATLEGTFGLSLPLVYATPATFDSFPRKDPQAFWRAFDSKFPGAFGYMSLSRPGFDRGLDRAVIALSHSYGDLGGKGAIVTLSRQAGKWRVDKVRTTWVS